MLPGVLFLTVALWLAGDPTATVVSSTPAGNGDNRFCPKEMEGLRGFHYWGVVDYVGYRILVKSCLSESNIVFPEMPHEEEAFLLRRRAPVVLEDPTLDLAPVVLNPVVREDPTPLGSNPVDLILVVSGPVVLEDPTPVGLRSDDFDILESGGPGGPDSGGLESGGPGGPDSGGLESGGPGGPDSGALEVSDFAMESPNLTASALIKKVVFAYYLRAVLHAWTTPEPAAVQKSSEPTSVRESSELAPVWEPLAPWPLALPAPPWLFTLSVPVDFCFELH
ncbi:hypothetical protein M9458_057691 [Cirrhinus mrigala]|uniref:Uncharacterized protein n=1 Tax=Cirrhinus mrigala TaxID=683832 RepID=A0ABD0MBH1_CIRMR